MASLAPGAPPRAVPWAIPNKLAFGTTDPAIVDAVWLPWPSASRADLKKGKLKDSRGPFSASNPLK